MSLENGIIKKSEMDRWTTYLLCPDKDCSIFSDKKNPIYHCEYECPRRDELVQIFRCKGCGEPVELPIDYSSARAVYSHTCPNGRNLLLFLPGFHVKIYERPK